jgi:hypothetical protein
MTITWSAARPPATSLSRTVSKKVPQYRSPTASNISMDATRSNRPSTSR